MNSLAKKENKKHLEIKDITVSKDTITATLSDGRNVSIPVSRFPRLLKLKSQQLKNFKISPNGYGVHWPDVDEDISILAFLD